MIDTLLNERFHYFHFFSHKSCIILRYIISICRSEKSANFWYNHMSKYLVYQARYRQLSDNYPKLHCNLLTLSLN